MIRIVVAVALVLAVFLFLALGAVDGVTQIVFCDFLGLDTAAVCN